LSAEIVAEGQKLVTPVDYEGWVRLTPCNPSRIFGPVAQSGERDTVTVEVARSKLVGSAKNSAGNRIISLSDVNRRGKSMRFDSLNLGSQAPHAGYFFVVITHNITALL
jgi:hypothetical protein